MRRRYGQRVSSALRSPRVTAFLIGLTLTLIALNLRIAITSVSPVLDDIRRTLGLSSTAAGLLTTAPVLCFGLGAVLAPGVARRLGLERALLVCTAVVVAGIALRIPIATGPLFAGTIVLGLAIAVTNVLLPAVIKRDFPRPGVMMGVYTMSLSLSGAAGAGLSVPLERAFGGSWRWALAVWGLFALLAAVLWLPAVLRAHRRGDVEETPPRISLASDRRAWAITGLFGFQSLCFYAVAAWLPDILKASGISKGHAGLLLSILMLCGIPTSLLMPVLAARRADQRPLVAICVAMWVAGLLGILLAPTHLSLLWMVLAGFGQGAGIALALTLVVVRSPDGNHAAVMSGMAQSWGYVLAAAGPFAVGAVHDITGSWDAALGVIIFAAVMMLVCGLPAAAPGMLRGEERIDRALARVRARA